MDAMQTQSFHVNIKEKQTEQSNGHESVTINGSDCVDSDKMQNNERFDEQFNERPIEQIGHKDNCVVKYKELNDDTNVKSIELNISEHSDINSNQNDCLLSNAIEKCHLINGKTDEASGSFLPDNEDISHCCNGIKAERKPIENNGESENTCEKREVIFSSSGDNFICDLVSVGNGEIIQHSNNVDLGKPPPIIESNDCKEDLDDTFDKFPDQVEPVRGEVIIKGGVMSNGSILLTDYRILLSYNDNDHIISLPICLIDEIIKDSLILYICTKQVRTIVCSFEKVNECFRWYKFIYGASSKSNIWEHLFSFKYCSSLGKPNKISESSLTENEFDRLQFTSDKLTDQPWRITKCNEDFRLCRSYPRHLIVPAEMDDDDLESVASFRYYRRLPVIVWRSIENGCIIARSSQPEVGLWGSSRQDQRLLKLILDKTMGDTEEKLLVLDARSYTAAFMNRAKGGGYESAESYPQCDTQFMGLANIHSIRASFITMRSACQAPANQTNMKKLFSPSKWYYYVADLIKSAMVIVKAIKSNRSVLVHCSDGWDRTAQLVSLAELLLDPYYRTFEGFEILVRKEWLEFGHKFADRCGNGSSCDDPYERCPVFLQWLDCVHQILLKYENDFEFNAHYLQTLLLHTYSCLFGTFLCNNLSERVDKKVEEETISIWSHLSDLKETFLNHKFSVDSSPKILEPLLKAEDMDPWVDVFVPLLDDQIHVGNLAP